MRLPEKQLDIDSTVMFMVVASSANRLTWIKIFNREHVLLNGAAKFDTGEFSDVYTQRSLYLVKIIKQL